MAIAFARSFTVFHSVENKLALNPFSWLTEVCPFLCIINRPFPLSHCHWKTNMLYPHPKNKSKILLLFCFPISRSNYCSVSPFHSLEQNSSKEFFKCTCITLLSLFQSLHPNPVHQIKLSCPSIPLEVNSYLLSVSCSPCWIFLNLTVTSKHRGSLEQSFCLFLLCLLLGGGSCHCHYTDKHHVYIWSLDLPGLDDCFFMFPCEYLKGGHSPLDKYHQ